MSINDFAFQIKVDITSRMEDDDAWLYGDESQPTKEAEISESQEVSCPKVKIIFILQNTSSIPKETKHLNIEIIHF